MKVYDTTPKAGFLRALMNHKWTVSGALSELVDNSFGPGRGNASRVVITNDQKNRWLRVVDNGEGMDNLGRLFQLGNTIGRAPGDIGIYGSGGTMALLYMADRVEIWSLRKGKVTYDSVDWNECIESGAFPTISAEWTISDDTNTPHDLLDFGSGTAIHLWLQPQRVINPNRANMIARDLEEAYAPGLRRGKEILWVTRGRNGGSRSLTDPMPQLQRHRVLGGVVEMPNGDSLAFSGMAGIVADLPHAKSMIAIGYGDRVIKNTRDCYSSADEEERYAGTGVCGFIDLHDGWQPYLSTTKDDVNDDRVWRALMDHVFREIRPLLKARDEARQTMLFADLQMSLQSIFTGKCALEVTVRAPAIPDLPSGGPAGVTAPHLRKPHEPSTDASRDAQAPAISGIEIVPQDDTQMRRCLCTIERRQSSLFAFVNIEHPDVAEAMKARPANTRALTFLITSQIAELVAKDDDLRKDMFSKGVLHEIEQNEGTSAPFIMRVLVDRMRGHRVEQA